MTNQYKTTLSKRFNYGWNAETVIKNVNGYDWQISTLKRYDGFITCIAQAGEVTPLGFSFLIVSDPSIKLYQTEGRATEKSIEEAHKKGLIQFDKLLESLPQKQPD